MYNIGILSFFHGGNPKLRIGPKILSVNILILNPGVQLTIVYRSWRVLRGCMVTPPGPWTIIVALRLYIYIYSIFRVHYLCAQDTVFFVVLLVYTRGDQKVRGKVL